MLLSIGKISVVKELIVEMVQVEDDIMSSRFISLCYPVLLPSFMCNSLSKNMFMLSERLWMIKEDFNIHKLSFGGISFNPLRRFHKTIHVYYFDFKPVT